MHRGSEAAIGDIIGAAEQRQRVIDRGREGGHPKTISDQQNASPDGRGRGPRLMRPGDRAGAAFDTKEFSAPTSPPPPRGEVPLSSGRPSEGDPDRGKQQDSTDRRREPAPGRKVLF